MLNVKIIADQIECGEKFLNGKKLGENAGKVFWD